MESSEEGLVVRGRVEIDMRKPFRSVKEAVELFGEKVLAGEIYGIKLKEIHAKPRENGQYPSKFGVVTAELEETMQSLQKAKEEGSFMAYCLQSQKQDLEKTKRELQQLELKESNKLPLDPEIEELKFIENTRKVEVKTQTEDHDHQLEYFQKKRSVTFASPPSFSQVISSRDVEVITPPSLKKKMKKRKHLSLLIPLIGGIFSKKKGSQEGESPRA